MPTKKINIVEKRGGRRVRNVYIKMGVTVNCLQCTPVYVRRRFQQHTNQSNWVGFVLEADQRWLIRVNIFKEL